MIKTETSGEREREQAYITKFHFSTRDRQKEKLSYVVRNDTHLFDLDQLWCDITTCLGKDTSDPDPHYLLDISRSTLTLSPTRMV